MFFIGILNWQKKMARKSWSVDVVNDYVIANFMPYAWCHHFGTTEPCQKTGVFFFHMTIAPNDYDRPTLPASNNLMLPEVMVANNTTIYLPMVSGSQKTKNNKPLDKDSLLKFRYFKELADNVIRAIDKLDPRTTWSHIECSKEVFGANRDKELGTTGWERVMAYEAGLPAKYWSFLSCKTKEEYEEQITNGNKDIQGTIQRSKEEAVNC